MGSEPESVENEVKGEYPTPYEQQFLVTNLVEQLGTILNEKAKLENENKTLRTECQELMAKLSEYEHNMNTKRGKSVLLVNFKESVDTCNENDGNPEVKRNFQCPEEQDKYLTEVNNLRESYYKYKDISAKKEAELINKIKFLKTKMEENETHYNAMKKIADANLKKYNSYKAKVKFARGVIKKLTNKALTANKGCQTEPKDKKYEKYEKLCSLEEDNVNVERRTENGILAKLFFKQFPPS